MKFIIPIIWREPTDHPTNCYFCIVGPFKRRPNYNTSPVNYKDIPSLFALILHSADLPGPASSE